MDEFKISRTKKTCSSCGAAYGENETFFSAVRDLPAGLERSDYCPKCWEALPQDSRKGFFSFWRTSIRPKGPAKRRPLDLETAREFFVRLHGSAEAQKQNFLYLLALLIMRKRGLVLSKTIRESDGEIMILHFPHETETLYHVKSPALDAAALEVIRAEFCELLDMEI